MCGVYILLYIVYCMYIYSCIYILTVEFTYAVLCI